MMMYLQYTCTYINCDRMNNHAVCTVYVCCSTTSTTIITTTTTTTTTTTNNNNNNNNNNKFVCFYKSGSITILQYSMR